jgi:hypothetical protein
MMDVLSPLKMWWGWSFQREAAVFAVNDGRHEVDVTFIVDAFPALNQW